MFNIPLSGTKMKKRLSPEIKSFMVTLSPVSVKFVP